MTPMYEDLVGAAQAVVAAEAAAAAAQAALTLAEGERDTVLHRLVDLEGQRAAVVIRRTQGDVRDGDGPELALLDADVEGLRTLLAEREAAVAAERAPTEAATQAVAAARHVPNRAGEHQAERALVGRAAELDALLTETVRQLQEIRRRIGRGPSLWKPRSALMDALLPLHHERAW